MIKFFNSRIKLFTIWDIKLVQMAAMCVMIILIKLVPQIISLDYIWYILMAVVFGIRPLYLVFMKKD